MKLERPEIVRPPSELRSYFLYLTSGCSNNTCTFCRWNGSSLKVRAVDEIKAEIDALSLYLAHGIYNPAMGGLTPYWDGKGLFLQDADALVYPFPKLKNVLEYLNERLPSIGRIASYAAPKDILRRTPDELKTLKELGLGILYTGLESGSDKVLQAVKKGANSSQMIEASRKTREAGIILSVSMILGLAGTGASEEHAIQTGRVLSEMDPEYAAALTLTLTPETPLYQEWIDGSFHPLSPFQSLEELKMIVEHSDLTDCYFSSTHASNYVTIRGRLPEAKARMISELEEVLARRDPALLRPEFLRGL